MTDNEFNALCGGMIVGIVFMSVLLLVTDIFLRVPY